MWHTPNRRVSNTCGRGFNRSRTLQFFPEVGTRRIFHFNATAHPTADWTLQQFREAITGERPYRFLIHDRDSIYSSELDSALKAMGLSILKTPFRAPQANAFCERLVGTIRRECLDFLIPIREKHLRRLLQKWVTHYNRGRPHSSLGPGIPGTLSRHSGAARFRSPYSEWSPGGKKLHPRRSASRIPTSEDSGMKVDENSERSDLLRNTTGGWR